MKKKLRLTLTNITYTCYVTRYLKLIMIVTLQIKIWFQNRRARERREKSATITPPQAVTLPPTSQSALLANNTCVSRVSLDSLGMPNGFKSSVDYPHDLTSPLRIRKQNSFIDTDDNIDRPESPLDIEIVD